MSFGTADSEMRKSAFFGKTIGLDALPERAVPEEPVSVLTEEIKKLPANYRISIHLFYYDNETSGHAAEVIKNVILFIPLGLYLAILGLNCQKAVVIGTA